MAAPMGVVQLLSLKSEWVESHKEGLMVASWVCGLLLAFIFVVLPFDLEPNPNLNR